MTALFTPGHEITKVKIYFKMPVNRKEVSNVKVDSKRNQIWRKALLL